MTPPPPPLTLFIIKYLGSHIEFWFCFAIRCQMALSGRSVQWGCCLQRHRRFAGTAVRDARSGVPRNWHSGGLPVLRRDHRCREFRGKAILSRTHLIITRSSK